jgi:hypothetical protein
MSQTTYDQALSSDILTTPADRRAPWSHLMFRRRRFLVNRRHQFRVTAVTMGTALVVFLLLDFALLALNRPGTLAALRVAPELQSYFVAQERFHLGLVAMGTLAFLVGGFLLAILETHRTVGAAFNVCRCLEAVGAGRYATRIRLRRGDNLKEIELAFNEMAATLDERALRDVAVLEEAAGRAERLGTRDAAELAVTLRQLAAEKRRLGE